MRHALGLLRAFGKFAVIQELGKLPPQVQKHLTVLGNIDTYKSYLGQKPVKALDMLYRTTKKNLNLHSLNWNKYPEIRVLQEHLPKCIYLYSLENILSIMKSSSKLMIFHDDLWKGLEKGVITKIDELRDRQIYDILSSFSKYKKTSKRLWEELERVITEKLCPKHNLQAMIVAQIIATYNKLGCLSEKFLLILEQQVLRVYLNFDGTDVSRILTVYTNFGVGSDELIANLCKHAKLTLGSMDWHSATLSLNCFLRLGRGDQVEDFEDHLRLMLNRLSFYHFGTIFYSYAKFIPVPLKNDAKRNSFIRELSQFLQENQHFIKGEDLIRNSIHIMYGMAIGKIFEHEDLWRTLKKTIDKSGGIEEKDDLKLWKSIEKILQDNNLILFNS